MQVVDFAIICALKEEAEAVLRHFTVHDVEEFGYCTIHFATIDKKTGSSQKSYHIAVVEISKMGNLASLHASSLLIHEYSPYYMLLVGICGGIIDATEDFQLGDVVVSDHVIYYEPGKTKADGFEYRQIEFSERAPDGTYRESKLLKAAIEHDERGWDAKGLIGVQWPGDNPPRYRPRLKVGSICSGEKVIANSARAAELKELHPRVISIEMEAAGIAYACEAANTGFLVIKSVSDYANEEKNDRYREYAAATAAAFLYSLLAEAALPPFPKRTLSKVILSDLFGLIPRAKTEIILPSYLNPRHQNTKYLNYPFNLYETAFDDVYCAFRIMPALEVACGRGNVQCVFEQDKQSGSAINRILIGSSISNVFTHAELEHNKAYFKFGTGADDHAITDSKGNVCYDTKSIPRADDKHAYIADYALISAFRKSDSCVIILAGCRAYGQVLLGDFLSDSDHVEYLFRHVSKGDYQCVLEAKITGRDYIFGSIKSLMLRREGSDEWSHVRI